MKTYAALALLSLTLAACSQQATPTAQQATSLVGTAGQGQTFANTQAAQEAQITAELKTLGLDGGVSAQAVAPQVYLNVLPVATSADSVRAYVKSTFTSPVTCSVTWGDGSASTSVASPTLGRIETQDHAYATFGTYTITVTCRNGASVVGTQSMTVQAGKKATGVTLNFEDPVAPAEFFLFFTTYSEKGFTFTSTGNDLLVHATTSGSPNYYTNQTQGLLVDNPSSTRIMTASDGAPFNLLKFDYYRFIKSSSLDALVTGYKQNGTTVTMQLTQSSDVSTTVIPGNDWTNLTRVEFSNPSGQFNEAALDNVNVSK
jgi:hypothetical protein